MLFVDVSDQLNMCNWLMAFTFSYMKDLLNYKLKVCELLSIHSISIHRVLIEKLN